nr:hypothetical protein asmbl_3 [uncultured bacterium]
MLSCASLWALRHDGFSSVIRGMRVAGHELVDVLNSSVPSQVCMGLPSACLRTPVVDKV